jgi:hexosaminidase
VEISDDGERFAPAGETFNAVQPTASGSLQQKLILRLGNTSARYLRIVGETLGKCPEGHKGAGNPCWLFVDEVYVE